jgi:hypothetical protein
MLFIDLLAAGKALTYNVRIYPTEQGNMEDKCEFSALPYMEAKRTNKKTGGLYVQILGEVVPT